MTLAWLDDMSVGNATIDSDHKAILELVNSVTHAIEGGDHTALLRAFELLEVKLRTHSANEANLARAVNFSLEGQKQADQFFQKELNFLKEELIARDFEWCAAAAKHYSHSLRELTINHIVKKDMQMKPVLKNYSYDFKPGSPAGMAAEPAVTARAA